MAHIDAFSEDENTQELQSLVAIYPSTKINFDQKLGSLEIPIQCDDEVQVQIKVLASNQTVRKAEVKYLPAVIFLFSLPETYPHELPPNFLIACSSLSSEILQMLLTELYNLWEMYHDQVIYSMIDLLNSKLDSQLDIMIPELTIDCGTDEQRYHEFEEYNRLKSMDVFNSNTYLCQICQNDVKGFNCSRFEDCNHIFCNACLEDFFKSLILEGAIEKVHCPDFKCTSKFVKDRDQLLRLDSPFSSNFEIFKNKVLKPPISIEQLSRILNSDALTSRYQELFTKHQYDVITKLFPKRLIQCPRTGCSEQIFRENVSDPLVRCKRCKYAFCSDCQHSWHGSYKSCSSKVVGKYAGIPVEALDQWLEMSDDSIGKRKLGYQYGRALMKKTADEYLMDRLLDDMINDGSLGLHRCPTCGLIIERLDGCNKMCCSSCRTFFCNLCGCYLDHGDPYGHFRDPRSSCYRKLFEGMPGVD